MTSAEILAILRKLESIDADASGGEDAAMAQRLQSDPDCVAFAARLDAERRSYAARRQIAEGKASSGVDAVEADSVQSAADDAAGMTATNTTSAVEIGDSARHAATDASTVRVGINSRTLVELLYGFAAALHPDGPDV